jgi:hypothetical protein
VLDPAPELPVPDPGPDHPQLPDSPWDDPLLLVYGLTSDPVVVDLLGSLVIGTGALTPAGAGDPPPI